MGRLREELLERTERFGDTVLDIVEVLEAAGKSRRVTDQMTGSGTSVGANLYEADEAISRPDFCKSLGTSLKELNETRYWLRLVERRGWVKAGSTRLVQAECAELRKVFGTMLTRSRKPR